MNTATRNRFFALTGTAACLSLFVVGAKAQVISIDSYDEQCYLHSHNAYANPDEGYTTVWINQSKSVAEQLLYGVRSLELDIWRVKQKKVAKTYHIMIWDTRSQSWKAPKSNPADSIYNYSGVKPEIVTAHEPIKWGYNTLLGDGTDIPTPGWDPSTWFDYKESKYQPLTTDLKTIRGFLEYNNSQVVTLRLESYVDDQQPLQQCFDDAGLSSYLFYADRPNPGCIVDRPGCPASNGVEWDVRKHGWPRVQELSRWGKTCVIFTDHPADSMPYVSDYMVYNADDPDCFMPQLCWNSGYNSSALNDMSKQLFSMTWHVQQTAVNGSVDYTPRNAADIYNFWFNNLWMMQGSNRRSKACGRVPNFLNVDFSQRGSNGGPKSAVDYFNMHWEALQHPWAYTDADTYPWTNQDVNVSIRGSSYDGVAGIRVSSEGVAAGAQNQVQGMTLDPYFYPCTMIPGSINTYALRFPVTTEGVTRFCYYAMGVNGTHGVLNFTDIKIDKTPPQTKSLQVGKSIVLKASDLLSGVATTYVSLDNGAYQVYRNYVYVAGSGNHVLSFYSVDNAGNVEKAHSIRL